MNLKQKIHNICTNNLQAKLKSLGEELLKISNSSSGETKSSMGDKYETSREMMQQEKNKIGKQIEIVNQELTLLSQLNVNGKNERVTLGSFVKTDKAYFYLSIPAGVVSIEGFSVFVLSENAPIAKMMIGKTKGEKFEFNRQVHEIDEIT